VKSPGFFKLGSCFSFLLLFCIIKIKCFFFTFIYIFQFCSLASLGKQTVCHLAIKAHSQKIAKCMWGRRAHTYLNIHQFFLLNFWGGILCLLLNHGREIYAYL
jgi:hypothetical protein